MAGRGLTVDAAVHPELLGDVVTLGGTSGDSDHGGAGDLPQLRRDGTDGTRRARDDVRVAGFELTDLVADPGGVALKSAALSREESSG